MGEEQWGQGEPKENLTKQQLEEEIERLNQKIAALKKQKVVNLEEINELKHQIKILQYQKNSAK